MAEDTTNLTGRWTGVYFYPIDPEMNPDDDLAPTPFTAELVDMAGLVTGTTLEPDLLGPEGAPDIWATLEGHHVEGELTFTKFPDEGRQLHSIDYVGAISGDANNISGRWIIHGNWSGTFQMQRKLTSATVGVEQAASA